MTEKFKLSRRKALLGLGTIGLAGAGAGVGTSALFTDKESFTTIRSRNERPSTHAGIYGGSTPPVGFP